MDLVSPFVYFRERKPRVFLLIADLVSIVASYYVAFYLRFEGEFEAIHRDLMLQTAPILVLIGLTYLVVFGVYRGVWRYASINDLLQIIKANTATTITFVIALYLLRHEAVPRSVVVIQWLVGIVAIGGMRFNARLFRKAVGMPRKRSPVLVVGAGEAGEMIIRQILNSPNLGYEIVGIIDDDPRKRHVTIHGIRVVGGREDIPAIAAKRKVGEVIIAVPSATGEQMQRIVEACKKAKVTFRTVPGPREIVGGDISVAQLREVRLEDLLGRDPITIETDEVARAITGHCVVITGAAGSIGSELCRQILPYRPSRLVCLDRTENSLFYLEQELARHPIVRETPDILVPLIGDIGNRSKLESVFLTYRPRAVFHAAAHKHVPLMERHPEEAVLNNIIGTLNVLESSHDAGAELMVLISTDKAVMPTSVMGASKRMAEILVQSFGAYTSLRAITVRFGNVIGSNGSVVPVFKAQIASGGPVTVTHPDMRRYFMTIPEAAQLITQAAALGDGDDIYILDMGEPVRIVDMAEQLITLSGLTPGEDIEIVYTGLRPGEKLEERLWHEWERPIPTRHRKILVANTRPQPWPEVMENVEQLRRSALRMERAEIVRLLRTFIPDYRPDGELRPTATVLPAKPRPVKLAAAT